MRGVFCKSGALCAVVVVALSCGAPTIGKSPDGFMPGTAVEVAPAPADSPKPWLIQWGDARFGLQRELSEGIVLVRYENGALTLLERCSVEGSYQKGSGGSRPLEEKTISSSDDIYAKLGIVIVEAKTSFERSEQWSLKYVVADVRPSTRLEVSRGAVPSHCAGATHFISEVVYGAYDLDTGAQHRFENRAGVQVEVVDVGLGGSTEGKATLVKKDGDYARCKDAENTAFDAPACSGILRVGLRPLGP